MIFIPNHAQNKPAILTDNETVWLNEYLNKLNLWATNQNNTNKDAKELAEKKYQHKDVKNTLITLFNSKCAYCESIIGSVSYGEIEHFAPKSQYPSLCFEWSNLLLSCSQCNNKKHKGTKFPLDAQGQSLLINPTQEDPNEFLHFIYNPVLGISEVVAIHNNPKGEETIKVFGLNSISRRDMIKQRNTIVTQLVYIAIKAGEGDPDADTLMRKAVQSKEEYAAFARQLWQQLNLSPPLSQII